MQKVKINNGIRYIAIFGENMFENLQLLLSSWVWGFKIHVVTPKNISHLIKNASNISSIKRYAEKAIVEHKLSLADYKSLWYELHKETIDLTLKFFNEKLKNANEIISNYNRRCNTNKFEAYIKKRISAQIGTVLHDLHLVRLSRLAYGNILVSKNPINEFVIAYMAQKYKIKYRIKWVLPGSRVPSLFLYYGWLFTEFMRRGIIFRKKRENYKLSMEAAWGFYLKTLRNDILIDNKRFRAKDILMLQLNKTHPPRINAFREAKEKGFSTASLPELKVNINENVFTVLVFYFLTPIKTLFQLFRKRQLYLVYDMILFHKRCFPVELLMNLYNINCYVSLKDWGDIEETIILNKYGTKSVVFHWSDLTNFKAYNLAFIAHNVCYAWGDIHHAHYLDTYFVDEKINIGCIYKKAFNRGISDKNSILSRIGNLKKGKKIVTFFDESFKDTRRHPEGFFLEYLELIKEFCEGNKDINVLLKPKRIGSYGMQLSAANQNRYKKLWNELISYDDFSFLDVFKWSVEEAIAISDVCITMGLNTPSTIALICGKEGLYFDNTGNSDHPFAKKYKDVITFDDRKLLFKQISKILNGKFNCKDIISEKEIREYDAFPDDNALERMRNNLHALTLSDGRSI